jgi:hypothetical protein
MSRVPAEDRPTGAAKPAVNFWQRLKEIDAFFQERDAVHRTMRRVARRLDKAGVPYAIVGGMAVFAHRHRQTTDDVDVLLTPEGFAEFRTRLVPKHYEPLAGRPRRFVDRTNAVNIDILVTGHSPRPGEPNPITYPDPGAVSQTIKNIRYIDLLNLIKMKLAIRRFRDLGDVVALINVHNLDESFAERLHPTLRHDYVECLEEKRREDEYLTRPD